MRREIVRGAVYLGVEENAAQAKEKAELRHCFAVGERKCGWLVTTAERYRLQNTLQMGERYDLCVENGIVADLCAYPAENHAPRPVVCGTPGLRTLKNVLRTALAPVGTTLYVYGGGWDWQDEASADQAMHIGLPPEWTAFFARQSAEYHYKDAAYYPTDGWNRWYYAGVDCSGYLGWVVYNVLHKENRTVAESRGCVVSAARMAAQLAEWGLGMLHREGGSGVQRSDTFRPGDFFSLSGHVWLCLGRCADGSLVIVHSTPSPSRDGGGAGGGVQLSALDPEEREDCAADRLCRRYMARYYPVWNARYTPVRKNYAQYAALTGTGRFTWNFADPDGYAARAAEDILADLYGEKK